jgi:hypothetical protein
MTDTKKKDGTQNKRTRIYKESDHYTPKVNRGGTRSPVSIVNNITPLKSYSNAVNTHQIIMSVPVCEDNINAIPVQQVNTNNPDLQSQIINLQTTVGLMQQKANESTKVLFNDINNQMDVKITKMQKDISSQYKIDMEVTGKANTDTILAMFNKINLGMETNQALNLNRMGALERTSDHIMNQLLTNNERNSARRRSKLNESYMDEDDDNVRNNSNKENYSSVNAELDNQVNNNNNIN